MQLQSILQSIPPSADFCAKKCNDLNIPPCEKLLDPSVCVDPLVIELFAGTARVTACLKQLGLKSSVGVDKDSSKACSACLTADMTSSEGQSLVWEWVRSPRFAALLAAPPCGTSSRAREIDDGPPPLRSDAEPDGISGLSGVNRERVRSANCLYNFLSDIIEYALSRRAICIIENPRNSLYWSTSSFQRICQHFKFVACEACAFGSRRPKKTVFATTCDGFDSLAQFCPGEACESNHLPWGPSDAGATGFATSEETAYPPRMAFALALAIARILKNRGWKPESVSLLQNDRSHEALMQRAMAGIQPKAARMPPLVSEHCKIITVQSTVPFKLPCQPMERLDEPWNVPQGATCILTEIPAKSQLLRYTPLAVNTGKQRNFEIAWGLPWDVTAFVDEAARVGHPRSWPALVPEPLNKVLMQLSELSDAEICKMRADNLKKWLSVAVNLEKEEKELKARLHPQVREIVAPKRILLWEAMMHDAGYSDASVSTILKCGVELTGHAPVSGVFKAKFRPMCVTPAWIQKHADDVRREVFGAVKSQGDIDAVVMEKTLAEKDAGWLVGPVPANALEPHAVISRRFGLQQSKKVRLIDNLTSSYINKSVQAYESPQPMSTDVIAGIGQKLMSLCGGQKFLGKAFDLSAAYRQLPISPNSAWCSYVACCTPGSNVPCIFRMLALPFGGAMSVFAFLRVAYSLWYLGVHHLMLPWSDFYDDYVVYASQATACQTEAAVSIFFKVLGWSFAETGDKAKCFAECLVALGISVNLRCMASGMIFFTNTEARVAELKATILNILDAGVLPVHEALRLRGRMMFANGFLFGRSGKECLKAVGDHAYNDGDERIPRSLRKALVRFLHRLEEGAPRVICNASNKTWFIFTDASYEPNAATPYCGIGGLLCDHNGMPVQFFSYTLNRDMRGVLGEGRAMQIILECEMLAMLVSLRLWGDIIRGAPTVFFIDNNAARDITISGSARSCVPGQLIELFLMYEDNASIMSWFARVPSPSNPADLPSRMLLTQWDFKGVRMDASDASLALKKCFEDFHLTLHTVK